VLREIIDQVEARIGHTGADDARVNVPKTTTANGRAIPRAAWQKAGN
jgi:hypothetical protein